ncbi:hypothetical protein NBRC116494_08790 [Aurantivibrio plasticivorans]
MFFSNNRVSRKTLSSSGLVKSLASVAVTNVLIVLPIFAAVNSHAASSSESLAISKEQVIVATRRITETQYRNSIAAIFGNDIEINGLFEPEQRLELLLALGSSDLSISSAGFNQYFNMARGVASHFVNSENREHYFSCVPSNAKAADEKCASEVLSKYGKALFRRPLTEAELAPRLELANAGATQAKDFYRGMELAMIGLLSAPEFLFRLEVAEPDPENPDAYRLDGYTKAARLSHLFWDVSPDAELLRAAASGELHTEKGVKKQVKRLLKSPNLEAGTRAFFSDMLHLDRYATVTKDAQLYPKFSQTVANSAKEQTLKTVVHQLIENDGDYRDLLTMRTTFMNRPLAAVYKIPFLAEDGWTEYTFPKDSEQSGLLTQISLAGVFSHPGKSSPTLRGVGINEIFLCSPTPTPPANVDFSIINDTNNPNLKTSRLRLEAHAEDPACSGCHRMIDPLGMALERFDALAQPRLYENGELIDVTVNFLGTSFTGSRGLGEVLYENERVHSCLVRNVYAYGVGRAPTSKERNGFIKEQTAEFAKKGFRFSYLLNQIATSEKFFEVPESEIVAERLRARNVNLVAGDL